MTDYSEETKRIAATWEKLNNDDTFSSHKLSDFCMINLPRLLDISESQQKEIERLREEWLSLQRTTGTEIDALKDEIARLNKELDDTYEYWDEPDD